MSKTRQNYIQNMLLEKSIGSNNYNRSTAGRLECSVRKQSCD